MKAALCLSIALVAFGCHTPPARRASPAETPARAPTGLYWGRWREVPEGVRVQVWVHGEGTLLRGSWELPPWHGEFAGARTGAHGWTVQWREEGVVPGAGMRLRTLDLTEDPRTRTLRGAHGSDVVELVPAGAPSRALRAGLWLSRWTGLPAGMGVETVLSRGPDGRWRAAYRYQEREGSFEGESLDGGALAIRWREVSARDAVAHGAGLLRPSPLGMFGTYGVDARDEGTGFWALEPLE